MCLWNSSPQKEARKPVTMLQSLLFYVFNSSLSLKLNAHWTMFKHWFYRDKWKKCVLANFLSFNQVATLHWKRGGICLSTCESCLNHCRWVIKYLWLLQSHLTREWMLILPFSTEDKTHTCNFQKGTVCESKKKSSALSFLSSGKCTSIRKKCNK